MHPPSLNLLILLLWRMSQVQCCPSCQLRIYTNDAQVLSSSSPCFSAFHSAPVCQCCYAWQDMVAVVTCSQLSSILARALRCISYHLADWHSGCCAPSG
jgi:hypothetical protein